MKPTQRAKVDSLQFRRALGRFASGITVITAAHEGTVHGMTANAFVSVSLDPPLVLISVDNRSQMHQKLSQSGQYGVSILAEGQEAFSQHFAGRAQEGLEIPFVWREGVPLLEGALAHLVCRVVNVHPEGDHTLYIGQVEHLNHKDGVPLIFYSGRYAGLEQEKVSSEEVWWISYNLYGQSGLGA